MPNPTNRMDQTVHFPFQLVWHLNFGDTIASLTFALCWKIHSSRFSFQFHPMGANCCPKPCFSSPDHLPFSLTPQFKLLVTWLYFPWLCVLVHSICSTKLQPQKLSSARPSVSSRTPSRSQAYFPEHLHPKIRPCVSLNLHFCPPAPPWSDGIHVPQAILQPPASSPLTPETLSLPSASQWCKKLVFRTFFRNLSWPETLLHLLYEGPAAITMYQADF